MQRMMMITLVCVLAGCTTGRLEYITPAGERKFGCETEYTWQPSVDKYAVEYVLAYCAEQAQQQGHTIVDTRLLTLDLSLPAPPAGQRWTHQLAKQHHQQGLLTDQQYGYVIAHLDLNP